MDFQPSSEQKALQQGVRAFCDERIGLDALAGLAERRGSDPALWAGLAELGVFALRAPEATGGLGLGLADAVLVFEELGRRLAPGPLIWSAIAGELIPGAIDGRRTVGGLDALGALREPWLVEHLERLDDLLVLGADGVSRLEPGELEATAVAKTLDPMTPLHHLKALPAGERIAGPEVARALRYEGMALAAALQLGIAESTLEIAVDYAKQREQFGRVIGSFQAIKHILADMFVRQELARAAVYAAGATFDHPEVGDVDAALRGSKLVAGQSAMRNARACIQVHGGMGFTWEMPDHYYLKRCFVLETSFGTPDEHAQHLGAALGEVDGVGAA